MRFLWQGKEFEGPRVDRGLIVGYAVGELRWAKKELKVARIEDLDAIEARILYYVLAIRRHDHTLLPISRFEKLTVLDFDVASHAFVLDDDGDCRECLQPRESSVHVAEPDEQPIAQPVAEPAEATRAVAAPSLAGAEGAPL